MMQHRRRTSLSSTGGSSTKSGTLLRSVRYDVPSSSSSNCNASSSKGTVSDQETEQRRELACFKICFVKFVGYCVRSPQRFLYLVGLLQQLFHIVMHILSSRSSSQYRSLSKQDKQHDALQSCQCQFYRTASSSPCWRASSLRRSPSCSSGSPW